MKKEYVMGLMFLVIGLIFLCHSVTTAPVLTQTPETNKYWCTVPNTVLPPVVPPQDNNLISLFIGVVFVLAFVGSILLGALRETTELPASPPDKTQTFVPVVIEEKWFVNDWEDGFQVFDNEGEAHAAFLKIIDQYREEAAGEEWNDDVERIAWGRVFQTVHLTPIANPNNRDLLPDDPDWDSNEYADAFAIEHRRK
jgi:hypothetical protein